MKKLLLLSILLISISALATSDSNTTVYILTKHINSGEYYVQKAPVMGCWGISKGPQLQALTVSYKVPNVGCGQVTYQDDLNALSCGKLISFSESKNFTTFTNIVLDISNCADKDDAEFVKGIKKIVRMNLSNEEVPSPKLTLTK